MGKKILIVDDEIEITGIIQDFLRNDGFETVLAHSGAEALSIYNKEEVHLAILDIMLPDFDGMELCRIIRAQSNIPIIMLSARASDIDKILSLGLGADDYMTKPFSVAELSARVKANLRRMHSLNLPSTSKSSEGIIFGELEIDEKGYSVLVEGKKIALTAKEFEILLLICKNPNTVFTKEQIYDRIWGVDEFGDMSTVTVHIRKIREKIEKDPSSPKWIKTIWGVGYSFDSNE